MCISIGSASLPSSITDQFGVKIEYLLITLGAVVFVALLLYMRFTFFLIIVLLVIGANLPGQYAQALGISKVPLVLTLALMVGVSLINHVVKLIPSGLERDNSGEAQKALFYAIEKGNVVYAQKVLSMNFDPNMIADNGYTPLMYAAARGDAKMVDLLLRNGSDVNMMSKSGDTAIELALKTGFTEVADALKKARAEQLAREEAALVEKDAKAA